MRYINLITLLFAISIFFAPESYARWEDGNSNNYESYDKCIDALYPKFKDISPHYVCGLDRGDMSSSLKKQTESRLRYQKHMSSNVNITYEQLLNVLHPQKMRSSDKEVEVPCTMIIKQLPWDNKIFAVLFETEIAGPDTSLDSRVSDEKVGKVGIVANNREVSLAVITLEGSDGKLKLLSKTKKPIILDYDEIVSDLDVTPYQLDENKWAFGFTTSVEYKYEPRSSGEDNVIRLFNIKNDDINLIFKTITLSVSPLSVDFPSAVALCSDGKKIKSEGFEQNFPSCKFKTPQIKVLKSKTNGYFDWVNGGEKLKWNGNSYEIQGKNKFESVNEVVDESYDADGFSSELERRESDCLSSYPSKSDE